MARSSLRVVQTASIPEKPPSDPWPEVSRRAQSLAAAIAAEAARLRALDGMATVATVNRVKASIPTLRRLLDDLEGLL
jgi:hypothetical protein